MQVYDIVKLKEDLDIRPVSGGGGFEIIDTDTNRRAPGTLVYPSDGDAEEARDRIRSSRSGGNRPTASVANTATSTPSNKPPVETSDLSSAEQRTLRRTGSVTVAGQTYTKQEIDNFTRSAQIRRQQALRDAGKDDDPRRQKLKDKISALQNNGRAAFNKSWKQFISPTSWVRAATSSAGVSIAVWQTLEERMYELYVQHNILPEDDELYLNEQEYSYAVASYYSFWAATTIFPTVKAGLRTAQTVRQIVNGIRAANLSATAIRQGISAATGPGFFAAAAVNLIWLLASELTLYLATKAILNSDAAQEALAKFIVVWVGKDVLAFAEIGQQELGKFLAPAIGIFSEEKARQAERDIRDFTKLNPDDAFRNRSTVQPPTTNGSTAGPATSAPAPTSNDIGIAPQFR